MNGEYDPLEKYLRSLPMSEEKLTLSFEVIEQVLNNPLPAPAFENHEWWGNQKQGTNVETIPWMDAGWMVDTVDFREKLVRFVRQ